MHAVSPVKHSYAWLPRKCDYKTDRHTDEQIDARQSDPYVPLVIPMCHYASQVTQ